MWVVLRNTSSELVDHPLVGRLVSSFESFLFFWDLTFKLANFISKRDQHR